MSRLDIIVFATAIVVVLLCGVVWAAFAILMVLR